MSDRKQVSLDEFQGMMREQGVPIMDVTFKCPRCGTLQSGNDLVKAGAGSTFEEIEPYLGFSCVGRFAKGKGCDWTLGGLFHIHELEVIDSDGVAHPRFIPSTEPGKPGLKM